MTFSSKLLQWYDGNKRDLPWRLTKNPYCIWVSEIIMQQTRIDQGLPYYLRFIKAFPTVQHLAAASTDNVLRLWQGLGYYSRARNMHATAQEISSNMQGKFPEDNEALRKLKGIGEYTAAAISSFCYNEKVPAIDGNVYRVITRLFDIEDPIDKPAGKTKVRQATTELMTHTTHNDDFNQAMMDFGATICTPKTPNCNTCIFQDNCMAKQSNSVHLRPVKQGKIKLKPRTFSYLHIEHHNTTLLFQRGPKDIWQGLYSFPLEEKEFVNIQDSALFHKLIPQNAKVKIHITDLPNQSLSHQKITSRIFYIKTNKINLEHNFIQVKVKDLERYAFPKRLAEYIEGISA